jgi:hypothetical protein
VEVEQDLELAASAAAGVAASSADLAVAERVVASAAAADLAEGAAVTVERRWPWR